MGSGWPPCRRGRARPPVQGPQGLLTHRQSEGTVGEWFPGGGSRAGGFLLQAGRGTRCPGRDQAPDQMPRVGERERRRTHAKLTKGAWKARDGAQGRGPAVKRAPQSLARVRSRRGFVRDRQWLLWICVARSSCLPLPLDYKLLEDKAMASVFLPFHVST